MPRLSGSVVSPLLIGGFLITLLAAGVTVVMVNHSSNSVAMPLVKASARPVATPTIKPSTIPVPLATPFSTLNQAVVSSATLIATTPTNQVFTNTSIAFVAGSAKVTLKSSGMQCTTSVEQNKLITDDFVGDGGVEAAIPLKTNCGGTGTFHQVAVTRLTTQAQGALLASIDYGDRNIINSLSVGTGNSLIVDATVHGPNDSLCCASVHQVKTYKLQNGSLVESVAVGQLQPLDLGALKNTPYRVANDAYVTLKSGTAEFVFRSGTDKIGQPFTELGTLSLVDSFTRLGSIDGTSAIGAIVMLAENDGGSGVFYKLAAVTNVAGTATVVAYGGMQELGDRPNVLSATLNSGVYSVTTGQANNNAGGTFAFKLQNNALLRVNQ